MMRIGNFLGDHAGWIWLCVLALMLALLGAFIHHENVARDAWAREHCHQTGDIQVPLETVVTSNGQVGVVGGGTLHCFACDDAQTHCW